jgi:predicted DNA-binding protein with PD1-like motif
MNFKKIDESQKAFILVFQTGDELAAGLLQFAKEQKLSAASFKAIGALSSVRLGWLSWKNKRYEPSVSLDEQVELLSVIGDVALKDGEPVVHPRTQTPLEKSIKLSSVEPWPIGS